MSTESLSPHNKEQLHLQGKILYLTKDPLLIRQQLEEGLGLTNVSLDQLMTDISTDEIIPNKACLSYTGKEEGHLGNFVLTGLRGGIIKPGEVVAGNFQVLVSGDSFAKGSSRIHAPLALQEAGIDIVVAKAQRIFKGNCVDLGINVIDSETKAATFLSQKSIDIDALLDDLSPISQEVMKSKGLLKYFKALDEGRVKVPRVDVPKRPMTISEKIFASHVINPDGSTGTQFVKPGVECVLVPDNYYGYELQTPVVRAALREEFGETIPVKNKEKVTLHNDHTALLMEDASTTQRREQTTWGKSLGVTVYELGKSGAPAICHTKMLEDHALPGKLILGNDSHTCTLGVLNSLAIGEGALKLAGAIAYDRMIATVPETIRIDLKGKLPKGVTMKDFMLMLGAMPEFKNEKVGSGRVFEFGGDALEDIPFDEQIKLANMSVEFLGYTGIVEPNEQTVQYLKKHRDLSEEEIHSIMVKPDENAEYFYRFIIDLSKTEPTIAEPGDSQNGKPLSEIKKQNIKIQKAYLGSCTHGTVEDLRQAAEIIKGRKVADGVKLFVQASSLGNLEESKNKGYIQDLLDAGAELLPIGCGACMNAGPGSTEEGEIGIFATNRNFPGRTGKGQTYLASPAVVAASAIAGFICGPENLPKNYQGKI